MFGLGSYMTTAANRRSKATSSPTISTDDMLGHLNDVSTTIHARETLKEQQSREIEEQGFSFVKTHHIREVVHFDSELGGWVVCETYNNKRNACTKHHDSRVHEIDCGKDCVEPSHMIDYTGTY